MANVKNGQDLITEEIKASQDRQAEQIQSSQEEMEKEMKSSQKKMKKDLESVKDGVLELKLSVIESRIDDTEGKIHKIDVIEDRGNEIEDI